MGSACGLYVKLIGAGRQVGIGGLATAAGVNPSGIQASQPVAIADTLGVSIGQGAVFDIQPVIIPGQRNGRLAIAVCFWSERVATVVSQAIAGQGDLRTGFCEGNLFGVKADITAVAAEIEETLGIPVRAAQLELQVGQAEAAAELSVVAGGRSYIEALVRGVPDAATVIGFQGIDGLVLRGVAAGGSQDTAAHLPEALVERAKPELSRRGLCRGPDRG